MVEIHCVNKVASILLAHTILYSRGVQLQSVGERCVEAYVGWGVERGAYRELWLVVLAGGRAGGQGGKRAVGGRRAKQSSRQ